MSERLGPQPTAASGPAAAAGAGPSAPAAPRHPSAEPEEEPQFEFAFRKFPPGSILAVDEAGVVRGIAAPSAPASQESGDRAYRGIRSAGRTAPTAERLRREELIGFAAREKFLGRSGSAPRSPPLQEYLGIKTFFAIIRAAPPQTAAGVVEGLWPDAAGYVVVGRALANSSIFHGFHSWEEACAYFRAARRGEEPRRLPPRRA